MDNQFNNYQLIADACGLDLKINYWESYDKDDSVHKHDFDYILTKGGEKVIALAGNLEIYFVFDQTLFQKGPKSLGSESKLSFSKALFIL